jgi:hypothetical protein
MAVALTPSEATPQLVGEPITWTATVDSGPSDLVYQFRVGPTGGPLQVVRDFSAANTFTWAPMQEGTYDVAVTVEEGFDATPSASAVVSDTVDSRVTGSNPVVTPTANPLVALYSAPPGSAGPVRVDYRPADNPDAPWSSTDTKAAVPGQSTNFLVAGLLADTTYELVGVTADGTLPPAYFTTGSLPADLQFPDFTVAQAPAPGSDLSQSMVLHFALAGNTSAVNILATDLQGQVNWYYDPQASGLTSILGTSLVPGGTVLLLGTSPGNQASDVVREVDLAGNTVRETNTDAVNAQLAARGQSTISGFSHDAERLPNGDTAVLAYVSETIDVDGTPTNYLGDMVIVLDQNLQVAWTWNAFDYLDTNRLPPDGEGPGDWLHSNSVSWSPADGDLIVSMRNQDWVVKIDYSNGAGDGHVVWRLGQGGDFTVNSSDPDPWFSHQHDAQYIDNSTLVLFDDGNTRVDSGDPTRNQDSRGQVWVLDEQTLQATLVLNADLGNYSFALGSAQKLPNGNYVFTSGIQGQYPSVFGQSIEVLPDGTPAYVLQINSAEYRSYRMSDLYGETATTSTTSSISLTSSADHSSADQPVTFTAVVTPATPGMGPPTGTVTFLDDSVILGTASLDANGVATFTTSSLSVGLHAITATYEGDAVFGSSASAPLAQVVDPTDQIADPTQQLPYWEFQNLSVDQVALLTPAQIGSIPSTDWFLTLPDGSLPMLTSAQVQAINTAGVDIGYLTPDQRLELTPDQVKQLNYWEFQYLNVDQVADLTPAQIGSIPSTEWFLTLPDGSLPMLTSAQVQAINTAGVDIGYLTPDQRLELTPDQVKQLNYWEFQYLNVDQVADLTPAQIGSIPSTEWFLTLPDGSLTMLTSAQVQAINTAGVDIGYLTTEPRAELTPDQVQQLPYWDFQYLNVGQLADLTAAQIDSIPSTEWFQTLPRDSPLMLSSDQIKAINTAGVDIGNLTPDQRLDLTSDQVLQLNYWEFQYLNATQVAELTPDQIASIPSTELFLTLPADSLSTLSSNQVQAINTGVVDIGFLTPDQRAELTVDQIHQLNYGEFQYLTVTQVLQLTPDQVASIPSRAWFETLSPDAQAALGGWQGAD